MIDEMLSYLNINSCDELFEDIPKIVRTSGLDLPDPMEEMDVERFIREMMEKNISFFEKPSFLPIIKPHYIPPVVDEIVARQEFYTSYTPYQPEASQGMLHAMFEYQSVAAEITGMDVANVSMYDSATALGEAALMACRITRKHTIAIPKTMFWHKKSVLNNYAKGAGLKIIEIDNDEDGRINLDACKKEDIAAMYIENPNFFGIIDKRYAEIKEIKERLGGILIAGIDPLHLSLFNPPSTYGADIAIGDGYLGIPVQYGGPLLGMFACKKEYLRHMPGRIIGFTKDSENNGAFCMTMQTREQHIRRGKATSNICSNQALCSIAFLAYIAVMGPSGMQKMARLNMENAQYMVDCLKKKGVTLPFSGPFFNEFVIQTDTSSDRFARELLKAGIHVGLPIDEYVERGMLLGVTELHTKKMIEQASNMIADIRVIS